MLFQSFQVYFRGLILYLSLNSLGENHIRIKKKKKTLEKKNTHFEYGKTKFQSRINTLLSSQMLTRTLEQSFQVCTCVCVCVFSSFLSNLILFFWYL